VTQTVSITTETPVQAAAAASGKVSSNFFSVGGGEVIGRVFAFASMLYAARHVGAASYGIVAFAATITLYLGKLADFGIETIGTDEIAKRRNEIPRVASAILCLRLAITVILASAAGAVAGLVLKDPERTVFALYFVTLLPIALSTKWIHLGLEAGKPIGIWRVAGEALALAIVVVFVRDAAQLWRIPVATLIGDGLVAAALFALLVRQGYAVTLRWDPHTAFPIFKRALPVLGVFLVGLLIYNMDVIFLRFMRSTESVGFYAAAYALIGFLANVCTAYGMTLLPTLTRLSRHSQAERHLYHTAMAQIFALTLPISVGGMFVARDAILLAFGGEYGPSGLVLQILLWTVLPYALRVVSWVGLVAHGHQGLALRAIIYGVLANAALNLILIDLYGIVGAAIASVSTEILAAALTLYYAVRQGLPLVPVARFWRPIVSVSAMALTLWALWNASFVLQLGAGGATYALMLLCLGGIKLRGRIPALAI
jgi:O-antigen/teichoic acid export membrane protein